MKIVEILAPAGNMECLKAAVHAGADAVYLGGELFGARAYAGNFAEDELLTAIDYAHLHGVKLYLTVNTLLKERELQERLYEYLLPYYQQGLDAVIVQDPGVFHYIRRQFPDLAIHASTQMTVTGVDAVKMLEREGAQRVVTARELSLKEIKEITSQTQIEIESFVHGALCYCYSGQCLFSSFLGGRSGNRGQCAQPCRLLYREERGKKDQYLLSPKDICTLELIPEMIDAGIYSFKIEGRMKKPEYVAGVTAMYRKYTDLYLALPDEKKKEYQVAPKDKEMLMDLYNRGGFHTGYYKTKNGPQMMSLERPNHAGVAAVKVLGKNGRMIKGKALTDLSAQDVICLPCRKGQEKNDNFTCKEAVAKGREFTISAFSDTPAVKGEIWNRTRNAKLLSSIATEYLQTEKKEKLNGILILSPENSVKLVLSCGTVSVEVTGDIVQTAQSQPMEKARIEKQMKKTGNTPFEFAFLDVRMEGNVFLPMQSLNELRRTGIQKLTEAMTQVWRRKAASPVSFAERKPEKPVQTVRWSASVQTAEQLKALLEVREVEKIYVDCIAIPKIWENPDANRWVELAHEKEKEIFLILPYIFRAETRHLFEQLGKGLFEAGWDGYTVRNIESLEFLKNRGIHNIHAEYNLYEFNRESQQFWKEQGIEEFTVPLELTGQEMKDLNLQQGEIVIYGHLPLMVSAGCVKNTLGNCRHISGQTTITDRYKKQFVIQNNCDYCYNVMYNEVPLYLGDLRRDVEALTPQAVRFLFTWENQADVRKIVNAYREEKNYFGDEFTRGHWKKGIK